HKNIDDVFDDLGGTPVITTEILHNSTDISSNIQRTSQHQVHEQETTTTHATQQDATIGEITSRMEEMRLYESTHYIGEGSLLMISEEDNGEILLPKDQPNLTEVDDSLKILPNFETVLQLIKLYFKHIHRYFPALKEQMVWDLLEDLSKPQHLLLLNVIFFTASPFHEDSQKRDGRIYFDRAEALLYDYCTQPHVLTVFSIIILGRHNKQVGSNWMYNGIASKMLLELGLHRKFKNLKKPINEKVEQLRNLAFWITFISENFSSATYDRPNMIDEMDCNIDIPTMPPDYQPLDEKTRLDIAFIHLINLTLICSREEENKFRLLDVALGNWFHNLPDWLKLNEMIKDPDGTLLNGIGGDIHLLFYTILILLHSRYLNSTNPYLDSTSPT
ncbi:15322_t:CDS:2, partial [Acaulospora morrowiae]